MAINRFLSIACLLLVAGMVLSVGCGDDGTEPTHKPLRNHVYLPTNMQVSGGDHFVVPVYFENKVPLDGISVPLVYSTDQVECDSISFVGSRVADCLTIGSHFDNEKQEIRIGALATTTSIDTGRGLLANLYFWAHGNAVETDMIIDTAFFFPSVTLCFADTSSTDMLITPEFTAGMVHIDSQL